MNLTTAQLAAAMDSTNLRLDASEADILQLCREAAESKFACVMIYPASVALAAQTLAGTGTRIGTVIGFPSGRFSTVAKAAEIDAMRIAGAHEVDIVMNYAALLAGRSEEVATEINQLTYLAHAQGQLVKIIVETCYLNEQDQLTSLKICEDAGADYIKTSTGFGAAGAKVEDIARWAAHRSGPIKLKASGGVKTLADAKAFLAAGAERLGTSSAGAILREFLGQPAGAPDSGKSKSSY